MKRASGPLAGIEYPFDSPKRIGVQLRLYVSTYREPERRPRISNAQQHKSTAPMTRLEGPWGTLVRDLPLLDLGYA
jgi:hypothetical protein